MCNAAPDTVAEMRQEVDRGFARLRNRDLYLPSGRGTGVETLTMHYTVTNRSETDIYALDAFPAVDQASRTGYADLNGVYICERQGGGVQLLKGIPPLPPKTVTVRIIPLGTKLSSGAQIERKFDLELPLKEKSVYYPGLRPEDHSVSKVNSVRLTVQIMRATAEGFQADPAPSGSFLGVSLRSFGSRSRADNCTGHMRIDGHRQPKLGGLWSRIDRSRLEYQRTVVDRGYDH